MDQDASLQASNYSSGFMSKIYPNRRVPDLCGLVGMQPKAMYIMFPLEPGDQIDMGNAGKARIPVAMRPPTTMAGLRSVAPRRRHHSLPARRHSSSRRARS